MSIDNVQDISARRQYVASAGQTVFVYPFPIFADADLVVVVNNTTKLLTTDYTVSGTGNATGGNATLLVACAGGEIVTLYRNMAIQRNSDFQQNGPFNSSLFNDELDKLTLMVQQVKESVNRALRIPITANVIDTDISLDPSTWASKYMTFDANGKPSPAALSSTAMTQAIVAGLLTPRTQAEITAGVVPTNFVYPPLDLRRYGADSTGVSASDTALANAILVCGAIGGTIRLPNGKYTFASPITGLANKTSIILQGDGSATGGAQPATQIVYSGTGTGIFIDFRSSVGCKIRDCQILHTNAGYTGTYMKFGNDGSHGDGPFCELSNCVVGSSVNGVGNVHVDLDKCICFTAYNCNFIYGNPSVKGMAASSYSNVIHFRDCHFYQNYVAPINSQGQSWTIEGCTFEQLFSGAAGAIAGAVAGTSPAVGLVIKGCWFGDVTNTAPAGTWIDGCLSGAEISGNYFSGNATSNNTTAIALRQASAVGIIGNFFSVLNTAINFVTGNCYGIVCEANHANSVGTPYTGTANVPLGQFKFALGFGFGIPTGHGATGQNGYTVYPDGHIEQWGYVNPASFGVHAITPFLVAFPTACDNVVVQLSGVVSTAATIYAGTLTTTGFTYTLADGTSTTDSFYWRAVGR